jgi:hypothetical protein
VIPCLHTYLMSNHHFLNLISSTHSISFFLRRNAEVGRDFISLIIIQCLVIIACSSDIMLISCSCHAHHLAVCVPIRSSPNLMSPRIYCVVCVGGMEAEVWSPSGVTKPTRYMLFRVRRDRWLCSLSIFNFCQSSAPPRCVWILNVSVFSSITRLLLFNVLAIQQKDLRAPPSAPLSHVHPSLSAACLGLSL